MSSRIQKDAAVRGDDEIVAVNGEIADGGHRHISCSGCQLSPSSKETKTPIFGSGEEHTLAHGIFADGVDEAFSGRPVTIFRQVLPSS